MCQSGFHWVGSGAAVSLGEGQAFLFGSESRDMVGEGGQRLSPVLALVLEGEDVPPDRHLEGIYGGRCHMS